MQTQNTAKRKKGILKRGLILAAACALALSVTACGGIEGKTSKESTKFKLPERCGKQEKGYR